MTVSIIKGRYDLRLNRKGSGLAHLVQIIRRGDRITDFYKSFSETTQLGPLFSITRRFEEEGSRFFEINLSLMNIFSAMKYKYEIIYNC